MLIRHRGALWLTICLTCGFLAACGDETADRSRSLQAQAPFLTTAEARILADPDPEVFRDQARHLGADRLISMSGKFLAAVFMDTTEAEPGRRELLPYFRRVTGALNEVNQCPEFQVELDFFLALPPAEARRALVLSREQDRIFTAPGLTVSERTDSLTTVHEELIAIGHDLAVAKGWSYRGTLATRSGRPDLAREMFTAGLDHSRHRRLRAARCNALASLIMQGFAEGNLDSTSVLLARGLKLARASRLGTHTGRLLALSGYQEFEQGHYAAAVRFFEDGVAACRNFGSPARGLAYLGTLMRLYAAMESWTLVDQVAQRATIMMREAEDAGNDDAITALQTIRQQEMQARSLMARGKVEPAHASYDRIWDLVMAQPFEEASFVANYWIMGLLDHGRHDLATAALKRAVPYAHESGLLHMLIRIPFWRARTFFQQGQIDSARVHLDDFAKSGLSAGRWISDLEIPYFVLRAEMSAGSDPAAADTALAEGLLNLTDRLAQSGGTAGAFLDLSRARSLRWATHDHAGTDPGAGYGLELMWRRLLSVSDTSTGAPFNRRSDMRVEARRAATETARRLDESGAVHLLYQVREPRVIRWTVGGGVKRDTLTVSTGELRRLVAAAQDAMSTDPGDPDAGLAPSLVAVLGELATVLLPRSLREPGAPGWPDLLLISGESFLSQIPFAPLNVGTDQQYLPLAAKVDLSWMRNPSAAPVGDAAGSSLVIADPRIDPVLTRRYRTLAPLPGIEAELRAVQSILAPTVLQGESATKAAILAEAPAASVIYFMGHVLHNPEAPFLTSIPLTPPDGPHPANTAALDIADIRSGDFTRCGLVVLSGCGSGLSFVDGLITAPSLGDAFLDAGAAASLQTFWRIKDADPVFKPAEVMRLWQVEGHSLPAALGAARREAMTGPDGIRHPFGWAAWSLKMNGLPD